MIVHTIVPQFLKVLLILISYPAPLSSRRDTIYFWTPHIRLSRYGHSGGDCSVLNVCVAERVTSPLYTNQSSIHPYIGEHSVVVSGVVSYALFLLPTIGSLYCFVSIRGLFDLRCANPTWRLAEYSRGLPLLCIRQGIASNLQPLFLPVRPRRGSLHWLHRWRPYGVRKGIC
jgi:hypothetical protein